MSLKVWTYDFHDGDFFIARSAESADAMMKDWLGRTLSELREQEGIEGEWYAVGDETTMSLRLEEDEGKLKAGSHTLKASEWVEAMGEGYFFSRNY